MPSAVPTLACPKCQAPVPETFWNNTAGYCLSCLRPMRVTVFPALLRVPASESGEPVMEEGESACFYHPGKRAVIPCDECGRFLCALCRVEFGARNWCPGCLGTMQREGRLPVLDTKRPLYDNLALAVAIAPALLVFPTAITAPMAVYIAVRRWRAPGSLLPRTKIRFWLALLLAAAQIAAWCWLLAYAVIRR
ncbi:MAG: hypothetical protein M3O35_10625 [Acidobacteriota bacterium]|nr:hypothetical protein [Acidobacteriota bacterium]